MSRLLIAKREFKTLEAYCIKSYNEFDAKKYFTKETHETKLQLLCYICNSLHENKKNEQALTYLKTLHSALTEHSGFLKDKYLFFYFNSMANNYTVLNPHKAIEILQEAKKQDVIMNNSNHSFYIYWNLAGVYFDLNQPKQALKNVLILKGLESFLQLSLSLQLHICIFEIVLRIDINQGEYVKKIIKNVLTTYNETLQMQEHENDFEFISLVKNIYINSSFILTTNNIQALTVFCNKVFNNQNNNIVDYQKWLVGKSTILNKKRPFF